MSKFVYSCLNHCNSVCKMSIKHCIQQNFTALNLHYFAANYKHLSYKYKICQDDWFMDRNLLIAKIKAQFDKDIQNISTAHTIVELCAVREGVANCDVMSCTDACKMIDLISLH